jgi:hypothetical protein
MIFWANFMFRYWILVKSSEGQETGAIAPAPVKARKEI